MTANESLPAVLCCSTQSRQARWASNLEALYLTMVGAEGLVTRGESGSIRIVRFVPSADEVSDVVVVSGGGGRGSKGEGTFDR
jgi:hypothetical protein